MAALIDEFDAFLRREKVSKSDFCRFTGFPASTLNTMRRAGTPKQTTIDRLMVALAAWSAGERPIIAAAPIEHDPAPNAVNVAWAATAEASSRSYVKALRGARFVDGKAEPIYFDRSQLISPIAVTREPCFRCGVRGDIGCAHRPAQAEVL